MPHQWQLFTEYHAHGLRKFRMPFDDVATDKQSSALDGWACICGGKLFDMSYDSGLGCCFI
jgi:hypothetical protein